MLLETGKVPSVFVAAKRHPGEDKYLAAFDTLRYVKSSSSDAKTHSTCI